MTYNLAGQPVSAQENHPTFRADPNKGTRWDLGFSNSESVRNVVALTMSKTLDQDRSSSKREIELDFIRGLAILMVLDFHSPAQWMSHPFRLLGFPNFGWAGVDVFFVLSGFLVGGLLVKEWRLKGRIESGAFLIRRGLKIWPQYYVFLGLMLLTGHRSLHELAGNLLNVQNYTGGIPHTWSLAVEEHAYLLLAFCLALASRWRLGMRTLAASVAVVCVATVGLRLLLAEKGYEVYNRTHTRIEGILYGLLLAILYHYAPASFRKLQSRTVLWLTLLAACLIFFRFQTSAPWSMSIGWDAANLLGVAMLMLLYRPGLGGNSKVYRLVAWIGVYSYGIYLWHVSVLAPAAALETHLPAWAVPLWQGVVPVFAGIVVGALFTKLVEFPTLRFRDRLFPRRVDSPVGTPAMTEDLQPSRSTPQIA